jgi:hypothetical protein
MGQFLAVGLAHKIITPLGDLRKKKISNEELRQEIEQKLFFDLKLYDEIETEKNLLFTLKDQVLEKELIPFLELLYPIVYKESEADEYLDLLQKLRSIPSAEWIDLADRRSNCAFQYDKYGESQYIRFLERDFQPAVRIDFTSIMLYMGYGKIITEGINDFLNFFKYCINETFKEHPIAKSIRVYITG